MGPEEWDYSHLCRQDRFTQTWLETQGYSYDVFSDTDLHLDPRLLDGYKVLFVVGHSEYWSFEAMNAVSRFLDRGGNAIVLSGNTAFWRVSFNADATIMECRKGDAPGTQVRADRRGEMWHSHDGRRGGMSRECGFPAWRLFGLEYFSLVGVGASGVGPYMVRNPDHFLFRGTDRPQAARGRPARRQHPGGRFRSRSATRVTCASRRWPSSWSSRLRRGWLSRPKIRAGITLLADGFADWTKVNDRRTVGLLPAPGRSRQGPADSGRGRDDLLAAARRRPGLSQRLDQFGIDARRPTRNGAAC